jgi:hypothetical protein
MNETLRFASTEVNYSLGIFEKILRKNKIFTRNDIGYNILKSSSLKTWSTSNILNIILTKFENEILPCRQFINKYKDQIYNELSLVHNSILFPSLIKISKLLLHSNKYSKLFLFGPNTSLLLYPNTNSY